MDHFLSENSKVLSKNLVLSKIFDCFDAIDLLKNCINQSGDDFMFHFLHVIMINFKILKLHLQYKILGENILSLPANVFFQNCNLKFWIFIILIINIFFWTIFSKIFRFSFFFTFASYGIG